MTGRPNHPRVRLLVADDHAMLREGFRTLLKRNHFIELVGEAEDGNELLSLAGTLQPDVVITDIRMPNMDGIETTAIITKRYPNIKVIAFTMFGEQDLISDMLDAGASGYLLKSSGTAEILEAINAVNEGKLFFCSGASMNLTNRWEDRYKSIKKFPGRIFTSREIEIIRMTCEEKTNKEIAAVLFISTRTVEWHRVNIQEKMGVKNNAGLVVYAIKTGIFKI